MVMVIGCAGCMFPGGQTNQHNGAPASPPYWEPSMERRYPFREWSQDLILWMLSSNLSPSQMAANLIRSSLGGAARDVARTITPQEILFGGTLYGQQVDGVTLIYDALATRFGPMAEDTRFHALHEFEQFRREPHERIDDLLSRFDLTYTRASIDGNYQRRSKLPLATMYRNEPS